MPKLKLTELLVLGWVGMMNSKYMEGISRDFPRICTKKLEIHHTL